MMAADLKLAPGPQGWVRYGVGLHRDDSVAGYLARGVDVRGGCYQRDCRRTCWLDLGDLVERGLGRMAVPHLKALYKCAKLGGCDLELRDEGGVQELRLGMLTGRENVFLQFHCQACKAYRIVRPDALLKKLGAERQGDRATPVPALGPLAKVACRCGATSWKAEVLWCDSHLPDWLTRHLESKRRQRGERV